MSWRLLVIGAGIFILAMIAMAPATLLDSQLQSESRGRLRLVDARGTLWSGSGVLDFRDEQGSSRFSQHLDWRLAPTTLLAGRLVYAVHLEQNPIPIPVFISWSHVELANVTLDLPISAFDLILSKPAGLRLSGELQLKVRHLSIDRGVLRSDAILSWHSAGSKLTPVSPLGNYEFHFNAEDPLIQTTLHTLQGPLQIEGQGSWNRGERPAFHAIAHAPPPIHEQIAPFLRLFTRQGADGAFEVDLN